MPGSLAVAGLIAAAHSVRLAIVIPLCALCLVIVLLMPIASFQGRWHVPAYCASALLALAFGLIVGKIAEAQIPGSFPGVSLSIVFFLAIAAFFGSVLAVFFHRQRDG